MTIFLSTNSANYVICVAHIYGGNRKRYCRGISADAEVVNDDMTHLPSCSAR